MIAFRSFTIKAISFCNYYTIQSYISSYTVFSHDMLSINDSVNYTTARNQLASLLDKVTNNQEIVIINRRNKPDVALISKEELSSLLETLYILRSPANAKELFKALQESQEMDRVAIEPQTISDLCEDLGIERE